MGKPNKPKFYVVWKGHQPGVYASWDAASRQVSGFPGAEFKSFSSRPEAEAAYLGAYSSFAGKDTKSVKRPLAELERIGVVLDSIVVDAACSGVPGPLEYRGVSLRDGVELFHQGPFPDGTNNIGEFLAIVHALALLARRGDSTTPVYSDSRNGISWVRQKRCATKLERTSANQPVFALIARAERWLRDNPSANPLLKWETQEWGEIPADFGRK
ncbi:MAG: ribonuclease H family protein [Bryobacterales bacterium]|nr:ribonuclease H family protein [Bryobacterales bacterium]